MKYFKVATYCVFAAYFAGISLFALFGLATERPEPPSWLMWMAVFIAALLAASDFVRWAGEEASK